MRYHSTSMNHLRASSACRGTSQVVRGKRKALNDCKRWPGRETASTLNDLQTARGVSGVLLCNNNVTRREVQQYHGRRRCHKAISVSAADWHSEKERSPTNPYKLWVQVISASAGSTVEAGRCSTNPYGSQTTTKVRGRVPPSRVEASKK